MKVFAEDVCISFRESSHEDDEMMHKGAGYRDPSMGPFLWVNISDGVVGCHAHLNAFEAGLVIDVLNAWLRKHNSAEVRPLRVAGGIEKIAHTTDAASRDPVIHEEDHGGCCGIAKE